jgi:membrane-bound lytic murein transglycosylase D
VRFQLGQKDRFVLGIYYSGRYIREMEKIFRDNSLPVELTRVPFVESSFNIFARSKVGASGIWQFMRRTARPLMMVNPSVDERNDPIEATRASARMLRSNFEMLQSWPLAVTGYNHGPSGVARITRKLGTNDLAKIVGNYSSRSFGFASENFYACFLAALEVEKHARKYLGDVKWSTEFQTEEIRVSRPVPYRILLSWFNGNEEAARLQNFHIQTSVRKGRHEIPRGTFIRVPSQFKMTALAFMQGSLVAGTSTSAKAVVRNDKGSFKTQVQKSVERNIEGRSYRVRRGDNLSRIARSFGVTISEIKRANNLRGDRLKHGQKIIIPD